jgi:hypothetical protein
MMRASRLATTGGAVVLAACATFNPVDPLRPRVAFDMHCAEGQMTFTPLSGDCFKEHLNDAADELPKYYTCTLGVSGCGQQATYVHVPNGDWVMNSTDSASRAAPSQ